MIDFSVKNGSKRTGGLVMEILVDGSSSELAGSSIFIEEEAFGFLEGVLAKSWPSYTKYGHWGRTTVPMDVWLGIVDEWDALSVKLMKMESHDENVGLSFLFDETKIDFEENFICYRSGIAKMIREIKVWSEEVACSFDCVTVVGI
ncbi:hypothetical protein [Chitiniphilus eburneus]|uniref:Uncharacterized protein n=1 Tax=Chitiniphilus eburneus TaxID=2571148 RepID=A0A4V5MQI7_9NEIS|nr:hypothetical protein [Chitiniphilus eburneus]TJZ72018.1 hypothetical protein FAZ21_12875 [Chitiniphilus eburneus]